MFECNVVMMMMMVVVVVFMSMGRDYVSELRLPTGLLFIPLAIYKHGDPWWNYIGRGKLLIRPPHLSDNPISRVI
jgi:ACR3 family arsenite efflux pump ArsB